MGIKLATALGVVAVIGMGTIYAGTGFQEENRAGGQGGARQFRQISPDISLTAADTSQDRISADRNAVPGVVITLAKPRAIEMTPDILIKKYKQTLAKQQRFALKFKTTAESIQNMTGQFSGKSHGKLISYYSGELVSDGFRRALRKRRWGFIGGPDEFFFPEEDAVYFRTTFDGREVWSFKRWPAPIGSKGRLSITRDPPSHKLHKYGLATGYPGHYLLGYINGVGHRMDDMLSDSDNVVLRDNLQEVGGVQCYVVDFSGKYGRGTVWFSPEHGYNIAQARFHIKSGDITKDNGRPIDPNCDGRYYLKDVSYKEIEGVWFPVTGAYESNSLLPDRTSSGISKHEITDLRLNPNLDEMDAFSTDDIPDGAEVRFAGSLTKGIWRNGEIFRVND